MTCKECDDKAAQGGELAANVRNASVMFQSAGKTAGWAEGARWAAESMARNLEQLGEELARLELPSRKRARLLPALHQMIADMRKAADQQAAQGEPFARAAANMVTELERRERAGRRRGLRERLRAAWRGLTG